jgi:hypothetical protein
MSRNWARAAVGIVLVLGLAVAVLRRRAVVRAPTRRAAPPPAD